MTIFTIISQFVGLFALFFWITSIQSTDKSKILKKQTLANVFYSIQYFLLGATSAACMNLISITRSLRFYYNFKYNKQNSKLSLCFFCLLIIAFGIITFNGFFNLIPILLTLLYTYTTWAKSTLLIRISFIIAGCVWIYYNISIRAYVSLIGNLFEIISGIVSIIRFDFNKNENI